MQKFPMEFMNIRHIMAQRLAPRNCNLIVCYFALVEQELLTLPEHMSSPLVFSGVRVTRSLVLYVCFVDCCLSLCTFSFGHCVVCSSSIYGFWLPLWCLQTLLISLQNWWANIYFNVELPPMDVLALRHHITWTL